MRRQTDPSGLMSSYPACRPDITWSSWPAPSIQSLPSPAKLCGRKRGKKKTGHFGDRRATSVCLHLDELKRKQRTIDKLKAVQWGGYETSAEPGINTETTQTATDRRDQPEEDLPTFIDLEEERDFLYSSAPYSSATCLFPWLSPQIKLPYCYYPDTKDGEEEAEMNQEAPWSFPYMAEE
ncbi:protein INCA1 [Rhinophrynus dorsalis]